MVIGERQALAGTEIMADAVTAQQLVREGAARLADERDLLRLARLLPDGHRPRVLATREASHGRCA